MRLLQAACEAGQGSGIWSAQRAALDGLRNYPPFQRFIAPKD